MNVTSSIRMFFNITNAIARNSLLALSLSKGCFDRARTENLT